MSQVALLLSPDALAAAYGAPVFARLRERAGEPLVVAPADAWRAHADALRDTEVIFSGWGAPRMDEEFLRAVPKLRAVFYAGGSVRYFVTDALWRRGVRLTTAQAINAIPVAEFTAAAIVLGLKRVWHYARVTRETRDFPTERPMPAAFGTVVGLVSYGTIARLVRERLRTLEVEVVVYDPLLRAEDARREGMRKVELDELFAISDAVSVHTPQLPETLGLIRGAHLERMRSGTFFLNTARGAIVNEPEMIDVLRRRPDLQAFLDVTAPEPPAADSPLYTLPNVVLTPHIAGSVGSECLRMGHAMIDEFERLRAGKPLRWEITAARAELIA
ncbi:MAG: hydroxyacid dehydrogenase [Opitutae bacterium]|nr:hydroxyacid dehydrogenase [Opitutae bacterium]